MLFSFAQLAVVASALSSVAALPTITTKGNKFFAGGEQFYVKGVAYQGTPADPLLDTTQCSLDASLMKSIGTNSIRVYHVNPWIDHTGCMGIFEDAGIYVWLDLSTFNSSIDQANPYWDSTQLLAFSQVMDAFQKFDNLAGFWIGNEVITSAGGSPAAPYVKAAVADMKAYLAAKKYRTIPIGYSAADIAQLRPALQNYLACGDDASQRIDFFGLNSYEWCGDVSYDTSGYHNLELMAQGYSIPMFFSETGCVVPRARLFEDQAAIFGDNMTDLWSGAIIYEWVEETNDYGLVTYPDGGIYNGAPTAIEPDFTNLKSQWAAVSPTVIAEAAYSPSSATVSCPAATAGGWQVDGSPALPTLGSAIVASVAAGNFVPQTTSTVSSSSTATPSNVASPTTTGTSASGTAAALTSAAPSASTSKAAAIRPLVDGNVLGGVFMGVLAAVL